MRHLVNRSVEPTWRPWEKAIRLFLVALAAIVLNGRGAISQTAGTSTAAPLARYLPQQDLGIYLEFEGLEAHAAAWHKSASYKLLNDTSLGKLLEDIVTQAIDQAQQTAPEGKRVAAADFLNLLKHVARNGLALGFFGKEEINPRVAIVIRNGNRRGADAGAGQRGRRPRRTGGRTGSKTDGPSMPEERTWSGGLRRTT